MLLTWLGLLLVLFNCIAIVTAMLQRRGGRTRSLLLEEVQRRNDFRTQGFYRATIAFQIASVAVCAAMLWFLSSPRSFIWVSSRVGATASATGDTLEAKVWLDRRRAEPPKKEEVGRNVEILGSALEFLKPREARLPDGMRAQIKQYATLPPRLTHVLNASEERQYFEAAQATFDMIRTLAGESSQP